MRVLRVQEPSSDRLTQTEVFFFFFEREKRKFRKIRNWKFAFVLYFAFRSFHLSMIRLFGLAAKRTAPHPRWTRTLADRASPGGNKASSKEETSESKTKGAEDDDVPSATQKPRRTQPQQPKSWTPEEFFKSLEKNLGQSQQPTGNVRQHNGERLT